MPELCTPYILLEKSAIDVIVGWITIHPLVEHHGIEREPPVVRRRMIRMTIAFTGIVQGTDCLLVGIEVVLSKSWIIAKSLGYRGRKQKIEERHGSKRQVPHVGKRRIAPTKGVRGDREEKKYKQGTPKKCRREITCRPDSRWIEIYTPCGRVPRQTRVDHPGRGSGLTASHIGRLNFWSKGLASRLRL